MILCEAAELVRHTALSVIRWKQEYWLTAYYEKNVAWLCGYHKFTMKGVRYNTKVLFHTIPSCSYLCTKNIWKVRFTKLNTTAVYSQ